MAETVLITGGSGFIGLELTKGLVAEGHKVVVFDLKSPDERLLSYSTVRYVRGDISNVSQVLNAVRDFRPEAIIHLAALLSAPSEDNPWASISVNAMGTYNILEAARLFDVKRLLLSSSMAVYINTRCNVEVVTEETPQRPPLIYGVTKVFSELLALYYHRKFGLDTRGIRLPVLLGPNVDSPGFGQYNSQIIEAAVRGRSFEVSVPPDNVIPLLYVKDAVRSLLMLNSATGSGLVTRIYNVGQIMPQPSTMDLVNVVRQYYPDLKITFNPDPLATEVNRNTPREIRCDEAQKEWGWYVSYSLEDTIRDFISTLTHSEGQ
jgi:threonine 3-dehydrogenase